MRANKTVCILSVLFLISGLMCNVNASSYPTVSFHGIDATIDLTYPEEAYPNTTVTYDVTITANTDLSSINIGILIYAPVNSTLQLIKSQPLSWGQLDEGESLPTSQIQILLPQQANGILYCSMTVQTEINQTTHHASYTFYTTFVSELTFSEMQTLYDDYQSLLDEYNGLLANYSSLFANYTALLNQYNALSANFNAQSATYQALLDNYNQLSGEYDTLIAEYNSKTSEYSTLQSDYKDLNSTHNDLQANYNGLQTDYDQLNQTYTELLSESSELQKSSNDLENAVNNDRIVMFIFVIALVALIAFIIYLKQEKEKPYLVIRKETVNMKKEGS